MLRLRITIKRKHVFEAQDEIDEKKEVLITDVQGRLKQEASIADIFTFHWRVV
jgi:hypothetical protein